MKLLALDSSTAACSVAVLNGSAIEQSYQLAPRQHAQLLLPMVEQCLANSGLALQQLDALAFIAGPGSFTGLRIAASICQGLAFAADLPVLPISSLRSLAQLAKREYAAQHVLAAIDARMHEVYWGVYHCDAQGIMQASVDDSLYPPLTCPPVSGQAWQALGSGWDSYADILPQRYAAQLAAVHWQSFPQAQDIATLAAADFAAGKAVSAEQALPVYIRNKVTDG